MQLSVKDAAALLRVPEDTMYRWVKEGLVPAYHIGGQYRFNRADLLEWATAHQMKLSADVFQDTPSGGAAQSPLAEALAAGGVLYEVEGGDKAEALRAILDVLHLPEEVDRGFLFEVLLAREALGSTGIGGGLAIPHVRNPVVLNISRPAVAVCFLKRPIDFGALDGLPVHTIFLLVTPTIRAHLQLLSRLAFVLRDAEVKAALARRAPRGELLAELARAEAALAPQEDDKHDG
jgi:PTS system nitrogen regulatory IIA component